MNLNAIRDAYKLLDKLQQKAIANPKIFCENYGQKEILIFREKLSKKDFPYEVQCKALSIVERIKDFSPINL